jgi:hypothetical protein
MAERDTQLSYGNVYEFDYYSGSQISCYIADIFVDEILSIEFQVQQSKRPVYGYASQYFHTVAAGQVLVQGNFTINFKEADYLLATLANYHQKMAPIEESYPFQGQQTGYYVNRENIERYLERSSLIDKINVASTDPSKMDMGAVLDKENLNQFPGPFELARNLSAASDQAFENMAEAFEDRLWNEQGKNPNFNTGNATSQQMVKNLDDNIRRADQVPPFDIWILYGDIANKAANHTIKKLTNVHILGQGQSIQADGNTIMESYSFLAQNLI